MTLDGTVQKSFLLATITVVAGALSWRFAANLGVPLALLASVAAFIVCFVWKESTPTDPTPAAAGQ